MEASEFAFDRNFLRKEHYLDGLIILMMKFYEFIEILKQSPVLHV